MTGAGLNHSLRAGLWIGFVVVTTAFFPLAVPAQTQNVNELSRKIQAIEKERGDIASSQAFVERELQQAANPNTVAIHTYVDRQMLLVLVPMDVFLGRFWIHVMTGAISERTYKAELNNARDRKVTYRNGMLEYRRLLEAKDERLHGQLSYFLNERARLAASNTGSQESKGAPGRWQPVGTGDCTGKDSDRSDGSTPDPARCREGASVKTAVCWPTWCTYKTEPFNTCVGGANPGQMYSCR